MIVMARSITFQYIVYFSVVSLGWHALCLHQGGPVDAVVGDDCRLFQVPTPE